ISNAFDDIFNEMSPIFKWLVPCREYHTDLKKTLISFPNNMMRRLESAEKGRNCRARRTSGATYDMSGAIGLQCNDARNVYLSPHRMFNPRH
ncbi:hypothetical protein BaRGS_00026553, partial [Batillaria attramentaria]